MRILIIIAKTLLGLIYFTITIAIAIVLFMNIGKWGDVFYKKFNYKVSQKFLGGKIISVIDNGEYFTRIHKPVFDGIFNSAKKGFIQIDWLSNKQLPENIFERVDYDYDGKIDFNVYIYPLKENAKLIKYNDKIINLMDRTSMSLLNFRGFEDGRYSLFTFHDYEEAKFLGYSFEELHSINIIKNLVTNEYQDFFNEFLKQKSGNIIIEMMNKNNIKEKIILKHEKLEEDEKLLNKYIFEVVNSKKREEFLYISDIDNLYDIKYIYPKTIFKIGISVRVMVRR